MMAQSPPRAGTDTIRISVVDLSDEIVQIRIGGILDWNNFGMVDDVIRKLFDRHCYRFVIDLSEATFISSAGFGCFIGALDVALKFGGNLVFLNTPEPIRDIFNILGLSKILTFVATLDEAVARLQENSTKKPPA